MGLSSISVTLIFSAFIAVQCLPKLQQNDVIDEEANDVIDEQLIAAENDQPVAYNRYYKRDWRQYICKYAKGKYPHDEDCSLYYDCSSGKPKTQSCPKGELFHPDKKKCMDSKQVNCKSGKGSKEGSGSSESKESHEKKFKCDKHSDGNFPHQTNCKKYYTCKKGKSKLHDCPKNKLYDVGDRECRAQEDVHCGDKENPYDRESKTDFQCPKSEGSFAHEEDCTKYYTCKDSLARLRTCPKHKLFDVGKEECENEEDVHCGNKVNPYDPKSKTDFKCPKSKGSFPHKDDCTMYYSCKDDLARLKACPKNKLFDAAKQKCDDHEDVHCGNKINPYDPSSRTEFECPKSNGLFAHGDNCTKYYSCKDRLAKLKTCPKNKLYDLEKGECKNHQDVHCGNKFNPYEPTGKRLDFQCPRSVGEFPHDTECNKYYSCKYGLAKLKTCPKKKLFDAEREECRDAKKVSCGERLDPEGKTFKCPQPYSFLRSYPDPSDCKKYYTCLFGKAKSKTCPRDERFDAKKEICRHKNKVKCEIESEDEEEEFVCPASKSGNFSVHDDCSLYYTCLSSNSHAKSCPPEQLFDIKAAQCKDHKQVDCDSRFNPYEDESEISDEVDYKCPKPNGLFPHEEDCRSYYNCHNGVATVESCPHNKLFDIFKKRCANERDVNCNDPIDPSAIHLKHRRHRYRYFWCPRGRGIFFHHRHCGYYYHCWHRRPSFRGCSRGRYFDIFRRRCYDEDFVDCGHRNRRDHDNSKESEELDDGFKCPSSRGKYAHETECGKYYECNRNKATLKTCSKGNLFDVRRKQCEKHYRVDCGDRIDGEGVVDENNDFKCPTSRGNYPYKDDCSRYFSCTNKKPTLKACPVGQLYDVERGDCEQEHRVDCGGRKKPDGDKEPNENGFRCPTASGNYPHESDCKKYYSCSNNLVTEKKCRRGQLFDVNRGSCEQSNRVDCGGRNDESKSSEEDSSEDGFKCPTSRGNHPHPECHRFYSCSNKKFTLKSCPEGQLYDVRRRDCDRWDKVDCGTRISRFETTTVTPSTAYPTAPSVSTASSGIEIEKTTVSTISDQQRTGDITEKPDEMSTAGWKEGSTVDIVENGTRSRTEEPVNKVTTGSPLTAEPSTGIDGDSRTILCPTSHGLYPHKTDCKKYYYCDDSIPILMTCEGSELFDARKSKCSRDVDCGRRKKPNDSNDETEEEPYYRCPSSYGNYPHEDCQWYYVCNRNKHTLKKCPHNKLFDTTKHRCENMNIVDCGGRKLPGDGYTEWPITSTEKPATGKGTDSNIGEVTGTNSNIGEITGKYTIAPVTGTRGLVTGTDSNIGDVTGTGSNIGGVTGTDSNIGEITGTNSNIGEVTGTRGLVTGTDSNIGEITGKYTIAPVTGTRELVTGTDSNIGEVTGTGSNIGEVTGTSSNIGGVTGTSSNIGGVTGTDSNIGEITGTGSNIGGVTGTSSNIGGVTGTDSNIGEVTGTSSNIGGVTGTDSNIGEVTGTNSNIGEVTGTRGLVTGTDSNIGEVTGKYTIAPVTGTRGLVTGTDSNIGDVTGTGSNIGGVTGTDSNIGEITGTNSNIGEVTGTKGLVTGTDSNIGVVTGKYTGAPGTGTGQPATGTGLFTRMPITSTERPVTGTDSNIGEVTGTAVPATGTDSNIGEVTGTGQPATATGIYTKIPITGSERPVTDTDSNIGEITGTRGLITGTDSNIGEVTGKYTIAPVTGTRGLITGTDSNIGEVTGTAVPATGTDSNIGEVTGKYTGAPVTGTGQPATGTGLFTRMPITSSERPVTDTDSNIGEVTGMHTDEPITHSKPFTGLPKISEPDIGKLTVSVTSSGNLITNELVTGNEVVTETSSEDIQLTTSGRLVTGNDRQTEEGIFTKEVVTSTKKPEVTEGGEDNEDRFVCPTTIGNYPYKNDCKKYYKCINSRHQLFTCSGNKRFDAKNNVCTSKKVDCGSRYDRDSSGSGESKEWNYDCPTSKEGKYPNEHCDQYYVCSKNKYKIKYCPFGELFDATMRSCQPEYLVNCGGRRYPYDESTTVMTGSTANGKDGITNNRITGGNTDGEIAETSTTTIVTSSSSNPHTADIVTTVNPPVSNDLAKEGTTKAPEVVTDASKSPATEKSTDSEGFTHGIAKLTKSVTETEPTTAKIIGTDGITDDHNQVIDSSTISVSSESTKHVSTTEVPPTATRFITPKVIEPETTTVEPKGILYCPEPNGLFPHPDPHKWVHCSNWEPHIKDCPGNLVFNRKLKVCSWSLSFSLDIPSQ